MVQIFCTLSDRWPTLPSTKYPPPGSKQVPTRKLICLHFSKVFKPELLLISYPAMCRPFLYLSFGPLATLVRVNLWVISLIFKKRSLLE